MKKQNPNEDTSIDTSALNKRLMGNIVRLPVEVQRAVDSQLFQEDGERFLDFWGDEGVCSLGYNSDEYRDAVQNFFRTGAPQQLPDIYPTGIRWQAAEMICNRVGMDRIFFSNSGTEAVEAAIKIARKHWWDKEPNPKDDRIGKRHIVLTVEGNFHGRTGLSMAAGDYRVSPYHRHGFGPLAQGFGVIAPDGDFNFKQVVTDSKEHEPREIEWDTVAAVIFAPVLGNNLVKTYPDAFFKSLDKIRAETGVLIIHDDVQAGSGRAGEYATWQKSGSKPDIMTLGKGIAMGHPMSCMLATEEVAQAFTPGVHFNTFGGAPFCCYLAIEMYSWLDDNLDEVRKKGNMIRDFFAGQDWIVDHDGAGLLNAFTPDFVGYNGFDFMHGARRNGLLLATHRPFGPIRFTPPLNVSYIDLEIALEALQTTRSEI